MKIELLMMIEELTKDGQVIYNKKQFCIQNNDEFSYTSCGNTNTVNKNINEVLICKEV